MDLIILGFLMTQNSTIYEIRQSIKNYLSNVSSDSTGSIQAALKKLLRKNLITFSENVENGVNRKRYAITAEGRAHFKENLTTPMTYKEKNMELSKFFFMGFVDEKEKNSLIDAYIDELEKELANLERINALISPRYIFKDDYVETLKQKGTSEDISKENLKEIARFQYATLDFSIEKVKFEIQWFKKMNCNIQEGKYE